MKVTIEQNSTDYRVEIIEPADRHPIVDRVCRAIMIPGVGEIKERSERIEEESRTKGEENEEGSRIAVVPVMIASMTESKENKMLHIEVGTTLIFIQTLDSMEIVRHLYKALDVETLPKDLKKLAYKELRAVVEIKDGVLEVRDFLKSKEVKEGK